MAENIVYELNDTHLEHFTSEVDEWSALFNLNDWQVICQIVEQTGSLACCSADSGGRLAVIGLAPEWIALEPTATELSKAALHEVLELLLWDFGELIDDRHISSLHINSVRHAIIRRLEAVIHEV